MNDDVYYRLAERLNKYQIKLKVAKTFIMALMEIYSYQEAQLASEIPVGSYTVQELAEKLNRDTDSVNELLEAMAFKGTIFVSKTEEGINRYALIPFVPGVIEFQLMRGNDTPRDRKVAILLNNLMKSEMLKLLRETLKEPEKTKQINRIAPSRIITVEKELQHQAQIYP